MSAANVKSNEEPSWREKFKQASPSCLTLFAIYTAIVVCFLILYWIIYFTGVVERSIYNWIVLGLTIFSGVALITIVWYRRKKNKEPNSWVDNKSTNAIRKADNMADVLTKISNAGNSEDVDAIVRANEA